MPLELTPGVIVPIPCRACAEACIAFKTEAGRHPLRCPRCGETTFATASLDEEENWQIRTEGVGVPSAGRKVQVRE
jgi:hypothetical protein